MTIGRVHPYASDEDVPEGKRLRMRDWLKSRIGSPRYPGLVWIDKENQIFRIPWKHAALHGWDQDSDGALFRDWSEHTGSCVKNAHPKQLKATFRCALHSLPDVHEIRERAKKRGDDACRVYKIDPTVQSKRRLIRIRNHRERKPGKKSAYRRKSTADSEPTLPVCSPYDSLANCGFFAQASSSENKNLLYGGPTKLGGEPYLDMYAIRSDRYQSNPDLQQSLLPMTLNNMVGLDLSRAHGNYAQSVPELCSPSSNDFFTRDQNAQSMRMSCPEIHYPSYYTSPSIDDVASSPTSSHYSPSNPSLTPSPAQMFTPLSPQDHGVTTAEPPATTSPLLGPLCGYPNNCMREELTGCVPPYEVAISASGSNFSYSGSSIDYNAIVDYAQRQSFPISNAMKEQRSNFPDLSSNNPAGSMNIREMCPSTFASTQDEGTHHMLQSVSSEAVVADHTKEFEKSLQMLVEEASLGEDNDVPWNLTTTTMTALPSASTLLTPTHSPTDSSKLPLRWITVDDTPSPETKPSFGGSGDAYPVSYPTAPTSMHFNYPLQAFPAATTQDHRSLSSSPNATYESFGQ